MKKCFSAILAVIICFSALLCLAGCGDKSDISKKNLNLINNSITGGVGTVAKEDLEVFAPDVEMPGDLSIYNYRDEDRSYLVRDGISTTLYYAIDDAVFFDVDKDGSPEMFSIGKGVANKDKTEYTIVKIHYFGRDPLLETDNCYVEWCCEYLPGYGSIALALDENGVRLVSMKEGSDGTKTVDTDYGYITPNGTIMNISNLKNFVDSSAKPDPSIFCTSNFDITLDGKEIEVPDDFAVRINSFSTNSCVNLDELKEITGFKFDEKNELSSKFISEIYGKKYVCDYGVQFLSDGYCGSAYDNGVLLMGTQSYVDSIKATKTSED